MYLNYHSKYIVFPVLNEHAITQYLKKHKLKTVINTIIQIIAPEEDILIKLLLKEDTLIIQLLFSTPTDNNRYEHIFKTVKKVTHDYTNITITRYKINQRRFNTLRGFN